MIRWTASTPAMDVREHGCECSEPGLCKRYRTHATRRRWEICQGIDVDPQIRAGHVRMWHEDLLAPPGAIVGTPEYASMPPWGWPRRMAAAAWAALQFMRTGFALTPAQIHRARLRICQSCEHWSGSTCRICGCHQVVKLHLPFERCPIGKWEAVRTRRPLRQRAGESLIG